ncbi:MAG TPA: hypothetical protein VKT72_17315 [Candidatus Baltobacteraceae bacterium]|nr:hypothetical protein [Candidatus Baltobacteraceae bacterium]
MPGVSFDPFANAILRGGKTDDAVRFALMGALRLTHTRIDPSTGSPYNVGALDPHVSGTYRLGRTYAARVTFDHTTVAPKPLEADRYDSTNVDQNGNPAPFVTLAPEVGDSHIASFEATGKTAFRFTYWAELEKNRIDVLPYNYRQSGGELARSPVGVPTNVGQLRAHGIELWVNHGALTLNADYLRAFSSSASEFAYNNLNAPAIATGHLFPVGYVPDFTATLAYEVDAAKRRVRIVPSLSYESGYPYGVGTVAWIFNPLTHQPEQVPNDNHVDPGANYYFLRDPSQPYNAITNPYIGTLGTSEGSDPNTLRSPPQTLVNRGEPFRRCFADRIRDERLSHRAARIRRRRSALRSVLPGPDKRAQAICPRKRRADERRRHASGAVDVRPRRLRSVQLSDGAKRAGTSSLEVLMRPHDIGDSADYGQIDTADDREPFHHEWEARVFALNRVLLQRSAYTLDEFRDAIERLPPHVYHESSYYERWLLAIENLLAGKGMLDAV